MNVDAFTKEILPGLDITNKTRKNYEGAYKRYLSPYLGLSEITQVSRTEIASALLTLKKQTKYAALMTARVIFREALDQGLIDVNPAAAIKAPKLNVVPGKFLTWDELKNIDFGRQTLRIRFLALHGLRYGEAVALTSEDIKDGRVIINKSKYGPTKTKSGVRTVPLMSKFETFPKYQNRIADALKPYGVTVHSLRKTYAYILKCSGVHVTTASRMMGHSNPMVTLKIYTLVRDEETDTAGEAMNTFIKNSAKSR